MGAARIGAAEVSVSVGWDGVLQLLHALFAQRLQRSRPQPMAWLVLLASVHRRRWSPLGVGGCRQ